MAKQDHTFEPANEPTKEIEALVELIQNQNEEATLKRLRDDPKLCDARTPDGISIMVYALYFRQIEVMAYLKKNRTRPFDVHEAAATGQLDDLRLAVGDLSEDLNTLSPDGFSPLHLAAYFDQPEAARMLLAHGADVDLANQQQLRPIHSAAASRSNRMVRILLASGADPDVQQAGGFTAMHSAAKHGDGSMVNVLLANGADSALQSSDGKTAVDFAREAGFAELAQSIERTIT